MEHKHSIPKFRIFSIILILDIMFSMFISAIPVHTAIQEQGYEQAVTNSINQEQSTGDCRTVQIEQQLSVQNKNIKVVLEFPTVTNEKAEEEFKNLLKGLYLKKLEIGSMHRKPQALKSPPTGSKPENNTKKGNSHG